MKLKKTGLVTKIVVVVLVVYATTSLIAIHSQIEEAKVTRDNLSQQAEDLETSNAQMEYSLENSEDDDVKASIARDKLGLSFPNEQIFTDD